MHQFIPSLAALVEPFRNCDQPSAFATFQSPIAGWASCLGPRTITQVDFPTNGERGVKGARSSPLSAGVASATRDRLSPK